MKNEKNWQKNVKKVDFIDYIYIFDDQVWFHRIFLLKQIQKVETM